MVHPPLLSDAGLEDEDVEDLRNSDGGCIPDTGSILTHGSTVVLAGNMGAAMRQRKKQTESQQQDHRTFDFDGGIKADVSKFDRKSILVENTYSSSFTEDRNLDDIAVPLTVLISGGDDTDNQSTAGINKSFKHHYEIGEGESNGEEFSQVQPKPDTPPRRLIRRDGRTSRPEDGALGTNHLKLTEKNGVARKNSSAAVSKRKDDHPTPTNGNTSNKWTGKMPSASFKIEVFSNPLTDFRTQATMKRTPQRGRGAVFGDLSLPSELVNKSSLAMFQIGNGVFPQDDMDPISDMSRDFAQRFGDKMNGIHAFHSAAHRDFVQSNYKTQNVENPDSAIESLTGDSYLEDIDSDNSDCESWDALPAHEAVSHSTRHLLMSASSRKRPQSSPALGSLSWRPQSDGGHSPTVQHMSRESMTLFASSKLTVSANVSSGPQVPPTLNDEKLHGNGKGAGQELTTLASRAGSNLGFDLFSSLAAIDAWAGDDDDSDVEEGVNDVTLRQCNEDIEGYEAVAEETYVSKTGDDDNEGDSDSDSDSDRGGLKSFHRNSSREEDLIVRTGVISARITGTYRANFAKDFATKILSKDIIQNMCTNSSRTIVTSAEVRNTEKRGPLNKDLNELRNERVRGRKDIISKSKCSEHVGNARQLIN